MLHILILILPNDRVVVGIGIIRKVHRQVLCIIIPTIHRQLFTCKDIALTNTVIIIGLLLKVLTAFTVQWVQNNDINTAHTKSAQFHNTFNAY